MQIVTTFLPAAWPVLATAYEQSPLKENHHGGLCLTALKLLLTAIQQQ